MDKQHKFNFTKIKVLSWPIMIQKIKNKLCNEIFAWICLEFVWNSTSIVKHFYMKLNNDSYKYKRNRFLSYMQIKV